MLHWAWRGQIGPSALRAKLTEILGGRGYLPASLRQETTVVSIHPDSAGGVLVVARLAGGLGIAGELSRALAVPARYAEVDLGDAEVSATSYAIAADGCADAGADRDVEATELCEEWFEGRKYRSEGADELLAVLVDLDNGLPSIRDDLFFFKPKPALGSARTQALVDAVRLGARWEKTTVLGRPAVRVTGAEGTRISFLDADELALVERELGQT
jgi:hypothetical protein